MKFAYADPPYPGKAWRYKGRDDYGGEVDHAELVSRLCTEYPDGWALSTNSSALKYILSLKECPDDVRVAAWVKPFCAWKKNVYPAYTWEPVIFYGGRKLGYPDTVRDFISANITLKKGCIGAKPPEVCQWIFKLLGAQPGDELADLYPGSGVVTQEWQRLYCESTQHAEQAALL